MIRRLVKRLARQPAPMLPDELDCAEAHPIVRVHPHHFWLSFLWVSVATADADAYSTAR